jgi:hypothetical protein
VVVTAKWLSSGPEGLKDSGEGLNPGNAQNGWLLKGDRIPDEFAHPSLREMRVRNCEVLAIGPYFRVANRFDLAPFQGAPIWGGRFPGLKPWAESCSPFGAGPPGPDHHLNDPTLPSAAAVTKSRRMLNI